MMESGVLHIQLQTSTLPLGTSNLFATIYYLFIVYKQKKLLAKINN